MNKDAEIIVIGAGLLGASLTYYLAKKGKKVVLLEQGEICSGVSSTTAALVLPSPKTPSFYTKTAWSGYDRMQMLAKELQANIGLKITGTTMLCRDPKKMDEMKKTVEINQSIGRNAYWVTPEEIVEREPMLNPKAFCGGVHCEEGGSVNSFLLINAYVQAAKRLGAQVNSFTRVLGFSKCGKHISAVHTNKGDFKADQIVCAAGNGSIPIAKQLGIQAHIKNTRGLILVSEVLPQVLHSTYAEMHQTDAGNLMMGANFKEMLTGDTDKRVYYDEMMEVVEDIATLAPALKKVKIIRSYSGIRVLPEDGLPIIGRSEKCDNFWIYLMHSAFSSATELSCRLADIMSGTATMESIREYDYARFER